MDPKLFTLVHFLSVLEPRQVKKSIKRKGSGTYHILEPTWIPKKWRLKNCWFVLTVMPKKNDFAGVRFQEEASIKWSYPVQPTRDLVGILRRGRNDRGSPTCRFSTVFPNINTVQLVIMQGGKIPVLWTVLGIHDILLRIQICGSVHLTNGSCSGSGSNSGSASFLQWL